MSSSYGAQQNLSYIKDHIAVQQLSDMMCRADPKVFSTKYSLTLPATALQYIEDVLVEVSCPSLGSSSRTTADQARTRCLRRSGL
jgi:hypothetical protein